MDQNQSIGKMIKVITVQLEKEIHTAMQDSDFADVTPEQGRLLGILMHHDGVLSMKEIERKIHLSQPTVVGLVKRLECKHLIKTYAKKGDRRVKMVELTELGKIACKDTVTAIHQSEQHLTDGLTEKEQEVLSILLSKVLNNVKPGCQEESPVEQEEKHG